MQSTVDVDYILQMIDGSVEFGHLLRRNGVAVITTSWPHEPDQERHGDARNPKEKTIVSDHRSNDRYKGQRQHAHKHENHISDKRQRTKHESVACRMSSSLGLEAGQLCGRWRRQVDLHSCGFAPVNFKSAIPGRK